jgi:hypothetical protein
MQGREWPDEWPGSQEWADEIERILAFLEAQGQLTPERFLNQMRGDLRQREGAFAHARVAYWLTRNGYRIERWEPKEVGHGDLEFRHRSGALVFCEVKFRSWQSDLSKEEIKAGRGRELPYKNGEVIWSDANGAVVAAARKTAEMKKFTPERPNLLVVVSGLRTSMMREIDPERLAMQIADEAFGPIGAVLCFEPVLYCGRPIEYQTLFFENPRAFGAPWQVPIDVVVDLISRNHVK